MLPSRSEGSRRAIHPARGDGDAYRRYIPLLLLPERGEASYVALNPTTTRVMVHWHNDDKAVVWCDETRSCPGCKRGMRRRVCIYMPVAVFPGARPFQLSIPCQAYHYSKSLSQNEGQLRGRVLVGGRLREGRRAPGRVEVTARTVAEEMLPCGWDVLDDLARRWGLVGPGDSYEGVAK